MKIIKTFFSISMSGLMLFTLNGCVKYPERIGPVYRAATANFKMVNEFSLANSNSIKEDNPNFSSGNVFTFNGSFNETVDWTIRVRSLTGNAQKIIYGTGNKLDLTSVKWLGGHTGSNTAFFKKGDICVAELSLLASDLVFRDTFKIADVRNFDSKEVIVIPFTDMETRATFPLRFSFGQNEENNIGAVISDPQMSVEGNKFFQIAGTPTVTSCDATKYFCGALQMRFHKSGYNVNNNNFIKNEQTTTELWSDPQDVWVNVYVYNDGKEEAKNSIFSLQFHEADASNNSGKPIIYDKIKDPCAYELAYNDVPGYSSSAYRVVPINCHDPKTDDSWEASWKISDLKPGWNLLSKRYADLVSSQSATNGGSGNKIKEPNRVHRVQAALISSPAATHCRMTFEYITFTKGKPFDPDDY